MLSRALSPKSCLHCGKDFAPKYTAMQVACSLRCATSYAKAQRLAKEKGERVQTRERKEALKRLPDLHREAQREVNKYVRLRDANQPCISCGAPPPDLSQLHAGRDAGHYRSVGSASHLRYTLTNIHAQCVKCNQWGSGMVVAYRVGLIARIGLEAVEALESNSYVKKWTREELQAIRDEFRAKVKALKAEGERE